MIDVRENPSKAVAAEPDPPMGTSRDGSSWFMWLISVLFFGQTALFGYCYSRMNAVEYSRSKNLEHSLGEFDFVDRHALTDEISRARFTLHVTLAHEAEDYGSRLLTSRKQKVRQQIEHLLRQLSGGYFTNPSLHQLKESLRTTIDEVAGEQIAEEVILTDLSLSWRGSFLDAAAQDRTSLETEPLGAPNR